MASGNNNQIFSSRFSLNEKLAEYISVIIVIVLFLIMEVTFQIIFESTVMVLSHIFYFPVILIAFFYPNKGTIIATLISALYLILTYSLVYPDFYAILSATMQFYVFISVAIVVSIISDKIRNEKKKFQSIFDYSESGICVAEKKSGKILKMNNKFKDILKDWDISESIENISSVCGGDEDCKRFLSIFDSKETIENREFILTPDGIEVYHALVSASKIPDGTIVINLTDVTSEKKFADDLFELNKSLKEGNKEANLYIDILAHDINNANTAAQGFAELLYDTVSDEDRPYFEKMMAGIKQSSSIIDKVVLIRDIHRNDETFFAQSLDEVIKKAASKIDADINYQPGGHRVLGGKFLEFLFLYVFENSVAFKKDNLKIDVSSEVKDESVEISIKDNGPGIPDNKKQNLFLRFQPEGNSRKGRGLGLPTCWLIADMYGGSIRAEDVNPDDFSEGLNIIVTLKKA